MYKFPFASTATPFIVLNLADVAGPPSPLNPILAADPNSIDANPATVVMIPVLAVTLRTTLLTRSPMK